MSVRPVTRPIPRLAAALLAGVAVAAVGGAALAGPSATGIRPVTGTFTTSPAGAPTITPCDASGAQILIEGTVAGSQTSPEESLTGDLTFTFETVIDTTTGTGTTSARYVVRSPGSSTVRFAGRVEGVIAQDGRLQGLLVGRVRGTGQSLVANFTALEQGGVTSGQFGSDGPIVPTDAAVLTTGCVALD